MPIIHSFIHIHRLSSKLPQELGKKDRRWNSEPLHFRTRNFTCPIRLPKSLLLSLMRSSRLLSGACQAWTRTRTRAGLLHSTLCYNEQHLILTANVPTSFLSDSWLERNSRSCLIRNLLFGSPHCYFAMAFRRVVWDYTRIDTYRAFISNFRWNRSRSPRVLCHDRGFYFVRALFPFDSCEETRL